MSDLLKDIVLTDLTQYQTTEYRRELIFALHNPGIEYDINSKEGDEYQHAYHVRLKEVDTYLRTFTEFV